VGEEEMLQEIRSRVVNISWRSKADTNWGRNADSWKENQR
jgi:hypothetical protein